jgi:hypothetical protein
VQVPPIVQAHTNEMARRAEARDLAGQLLPDGIAGASVESQDGDAHGIRSCATTQLDGGS